LVNCRRSECDRSNGVHLRSSLLIGDSSTVVENISPVSSSRTSLNIPAGHAIQELAFVNLFPEFSTIHHALTATEQAVPFIRKILKNGKGAEWSPGLPTESLCLEAEAKNHSTRNLRLWLKRS